VVPSLAFMCKSKPEIDCCQTCGSAIGPPKAKGRPRLYCDSCRAVRAKEAAVVPPRKHTCVECGKTWIAKWNPKYCSDKCRHLSEAKQRCRTFHKCCMSCGQSFVAKSKKTRLCRQCWHKRPRGGRDVQCMQCSSTFYCTPSGDSKYCSRKCAHSAKRLVHTCKHCGKQFCRRKFRNSDTRQYCRIQCYWDANGMDGSKAAKARSYGLCLGSVRKRCRRLGVSYDPSVTIEKVAKRDGYVCQLCGKDCNKVWLVAKGSRTPHPRNRTVDHIIPLSERLYGHEWRNVQCACYSCNVRKSSNRRTDQLRLC
jgi:hypothetical protein